MTEEVKEETPKRKPGRPKGAKNKPKGWYEEAALRKWEKNLHAYICKEGKVMLWVDSDDADEVTEWLGDLYLSRKQPGRLKRWFNKFWPVKGE